MEPVIHGSPVLPLSGSSVPRCSGSRICPFSFAMLYPLFLKSANSWAHFLLAAARVVGSSALVFLSSLVLVFLSSLVLLFSVQLLTQTLMLRGSQTPIFSRIVKSQKVIQRLTFCWKSLQFQTFYAIITMALPRNGKRLVPCIFAGALLAPLF